MIAYSAVSVLNKATGRNLDWHEVDKPYDPLLDDLDMDTLMEDDMDSESG